MSKASGQGLHHAVTVACAGRFHLFDEAQQLYKRGLLRQLVTDLPAGRAMQWGIPRGKTHSSPHRMMLNLMRMKVAERMPFELRSRLIRSIHQGFARSLESRVRGEPDALIVHSSFFADALPWTRQMGICSVVDHGSLHESAVRDILQAECDAYGFEPFGNWPHSWLIQRESEEFAQADRVFVCSRLAKRTLVEQGVEAEKVFVNRLGVDLSMFSAGVKRDDVFRVIYCSGVNPRKGLHYLLKAFEALDLPNAELWVIGVMDPDPAFRKHIAPYFENEKIIYKGGFPQSELRGLYAQGSVFVLPSLADGWGMVVLQAMACGLPVIVTDMTGACEAVEDGVNGFVIPSRSVDALREKIEWCYRNKEQLGAMGANAIQTVQSGYSWDDYGQRLAAFLEREYASI